MSLAGERVLLRVYLLTTDQVHLMPAYEWLVRRARKRGLAGATVLKGIYGFGSRGICEGAGSGWHVSVKEPVIVEVVDSGGRVEGFLREEVWGVLRHGTVTLERAGVLMYRHRGASDAKEPLELLGRVKDLSTVGGLEVHDARGEVMKIDEAGVLLRIFAGEADQVAGRPLYEAVVKKARELGLAGATVLRGSMGFGANSVLHTAKVVELSTDLPIVMELVDTEEKIRRLLPYLEEVVKEGMITMEAVRVVAYRHNPADG